MVHERVSGTLGIRNYEQLVKDELACNDNINGLNFFYTT